MFVWWSLGVFIVVIGLSGYAISQLLARVAPLAAGDRALFALPLGGAVIGWVEFCGNEFGGLPITASFVYAVTLPLAGLGVVLLGRQVVGWRRSRISSSAQSESPARLTAARWTRLAWAELGIIVLLLTRQVLENWGTPLMHFDALTYHLPFAKVIYQTHALPKFASPSEISMLLASPPLLFLWYATTWLWLGKIHLFLPSMTAILFGGLLCGLVYRATRRLLGVAPQAALGAVLCLLLPGLFVELLQGWQSTTDLPFAFWGVAAVYCLLLDLTEERAVRWVWVGLCGALACWSKPYGFPFGVVCMSVMILQWGLSRWNRGTRWPYSITTIGKVALVGGGLVFPLLLRNWLQWGNPVYPAFARWLGGYLIDEWALQHIWHLRAYPQDIERLLITFFKEPGVALAGLAIFHPAVRRTSHLLTIWLIAVGYVLLYAVLFGDTAKGVAHSRYLLPSIVLFTLFVSCFLDQRQYPVDRRFQGILVGGLVVQIGRIGYELWTGTWHSSVLSSTNLSSVKAVAYERLPLLLVGGFWGLALLFRRWPVRIIQLRLALISGCCLVLTYMWPLTVPWAFLLQPLQRPAVDWTDVPLISSYGSWMETHLPKSAVLVTEEHRRWIVPRHILPADSPLLQDLYDSKVSLIMKLTRLAELGVTHIVARGKEGHPWPLRTAVASWSFLDDPESGRYFKQLYHAPPVPPNEDPLGFTETETYVYEIVYPPDLQRLVQEPRPRPWLYEYATVGSLIP